MPSVSLEDWKVVWKDIGAILQYSSLSFAIPVIVSLIYREALQNALAFAFAGLIAFFFGWILKKRISVRKDTELKHALIAVALLWIVYTAIAALPFVFSAGMNFLDSFFEAMSSITTTGLTVIPLVEELPKSLIFWRSFLSWIGGIGFIVMALVGLTGYQKTAKYVVAEGRNLAIKPNLKNTAKAIVKVYLVLTLIGIVLLLAAGMGFFDSINYSMSAISTGGMTTTSSGLVGISNTAIDWILVLLMVLGATNFAAHYAFYKRKELKAYLSDIEFRLLIFLVVVGVLAIFPSLFMFYGNSTIALNHAVLESSSAVTNGGFMSDLVQSISLWPSSVVIGLTLLMFVGGSMGSTSGGIKLHRFWVFVKSLYWKTKSMVLPENTFFPRKIDEKTIEEKEIRIVKDFILFYALAILIGTAILTLDGNSIGKALFETASAQGNGGLSIGVTKEGMSALSETMLIVNMWIGRIEIIPAIALIGAILRRK